MVIGGGVIGAAVAREASRAGADVVLVDRSRPGRATSGSAGGLWPLGEGLGLGCGVIFHKMQLESGEEGRPPTLPPEFFAFALASNSCFPALAREIQEETGIDVELEETSLLFLFLDEGDVGFARQLYETAPCDRTLFEWIEPDALRVLEPTLTVSSRGALRFIGDDQVNPYKLADGLIASARYHGARHLPDTAVEGIERDGDRVVAVLTSSGRIPCRSVVNAAGSWAGEVAAGVGVDLPIRPVRGQIVCTERLEESLRACVSTSACYFLQKKNGEIIIGSTTEEVGFDPGVTAPAVRDLSAGAMAAMPVLEHVRVKRVWAGLRPGTPDELPILGPVEGLEGYFNASGHFRTGILNAPLTGLVLTDCLRGETPRIDLAPFLLSRFDR